VKTLQKKVEDLTSDLASFVRGTKNLKKLMGTSRHPSDKFRLGYKKEGKHVTKIKLYSKCTICGKSGHFADKSFHRKQKFQSYGTNPKGPKKIWVPKDMIVALAYVLNRMKETPKMVSGKWLLTSHDERKVYIPRLTTT